MRRACPSISRLPAPPLLLRCAAPLHTTAPASSAILLGGLSVAGAALAARFALQRLDGGGSSAAGGAPPPPPPEDGAEGKGEGAEGRVEGASAPEGSEGAAPGGGEAKKARSFGADFLSKRFYRGGFEEKMTRREAALVLGVRESATPERVRERHRKMLMANHPDKGGSTYIAEKVNEAKDYLLKGGSK